MPGANTNQHPPLADTADENAANSDHASNDFKTTRQKHHRNAKNPKSPAAPNETKFVAPAKKMKLHNNNVLANGRECGVVYIDTDEATYQATIPRLLKRTEKTATYRADHDKLVWKPWEDPLEDEKMESRNEYWMACLRQFVGHVTHDQALEHLMDNGHCVTKSLETIDVLLEKLGQPYAELRGARVQYFENLRKNQNALGSVKAKENYQRYTMEEQKEFYHFFKYTDIGKKKQSACNHNDPLGKPIDFEPRWACSNCRKGDLPSVLLNGVEKLCLICQTHRKLSGKLPNFTKVFFNNVDGKKIAEWEAFELLEEKPVSRKEFEEHMQELEDDLYVKHEDWEITDEEFAYVKRNLYNKNGNEGLIKENFSGREWAQFLEPRHFPIFRECDCSEETKNGVVNGLNGAAAQ